MLGGQDRATRGDAADQRQRQLHHAGHRQRELVRHFGVAAIDLEADAARSAGGQLDHALASQRAQMFFGRIRRREAEFRSDLGAGRRNAGLPDGVADQVEDLLLPGCQSRHGLSVLLYPVAVRSSPRAVRRAGREHRGPPCATLYV